MKCMNPFWKEIYTSLLECRLNVLLDFPQEYRYVPINGEPHITSNGISIGQDWSENRNLNDIIDNNGNFRDLDRIDENRRPFEYEYSELRKTLKDFLDIYSGGRLGANSCRLGVPNNSDGSFNIYGCFFTKRKKGCLHFV